MLRRHLSPERERARALVVTEPEAYRVATDLVALDLDCFDALLERSAREPTRRARASLEQALALVRGEVLEDEPYATWALDIRGSYQGRILGARLEAADAALAELDFGPALDHAEAAVALDGFSERAHRGQMLALYALGRSHEALARYRSFRLRLDDELGLEPGAEIRALESAVLRQEDAHSLLPRPIRRAQADGGRPPLRLLGRDDELETLTRDVRRGLDGRFVLLRVEGDRGLGKSRMLDELAASLDDVRIGRASCSELERQLPYVPLAAALRDALAGVELDAGERPALVHVLPELALTGGKPEADEVEVLEALVSLLAEHGPMVLLIDDLHRSDAQTIAALGYLRRRHASLGGAMVITVRSGDAPADHPLHLLEPDEIVRLEPLSAEDLAPLGRPDLHKATGGNPRFVAEALAGGRPSRPSPTLSEALLAQVRAEGPWGYRVLMTASVLDQPFDPEPLAELLATDAAELTEELERLCERRILRIDGLFFRFRSDLVRLVLLERVSPARQRLLRQRLAETSSPPLAEVLRVGAG